MNPAFHLYQLQKIDTELMNLETRLVEIDKVISGDKRIAAIDRAQSQVNALLDKKQKKLKEFEAGAKSIHLEIETNESTLYSGTIKNPKELNDLQHKINADKRNLGKNEENQLEVLMSIEEIESKLDELAAKHVEVESLVATEHAQLMGERSQLLKQKERLETERNAKQSSIPEPILQVYTKLLDTKRGVAVSAVEDLSCTMCGAPLTQGEWQSARSAATLSFCSTCGRILYAS